MGGTISVEKRINDFDYRIQRGFRTKMDVIHFYRLTSHKRMYTDEVISTKKRAV